MPLPKFWNDPEFGKTPFQRATILAISLIFLLFIWHRNYNLLGDLYDYSGLTSANGHLEAGLRPYRDFTTPYQSLTMYLSCASEMIFGQRYLSLAYANLAVALANYFLLLRLLKPGLSFLARVLVASALCLCTFFQHGILWYNSLAMMFLALTCLQAVRIFRADKIRAWDVAQLCLWLLLSSMNKFTFHLLALGLVFLLLAVRLWIRPADFRAVLLVGVALVLFGLIFGLAIELLLNRTTLAVYIQNIFVVPSGRARDLGKMFTLPMLFGSIESYYPDDLSLGAYGFVLLIYLLSLQRLGWLGQTVAPAASSREIAFAKYGALVALPIFFVASALLTATNMETQVLTSSFLLTGLVCVFLLLERGLPALRKATLQSSILFLAAYFVIVGAGSAYMHSRLRFGDATWAGSIAFNVYEQRRLSAALEGLPLYDAESISPRFEPYWTGVKFTQRARDRLAKVAAFMSRTHPDGDGRDVYWGPGFEMLNRVYGSRYTGRLPLWYHYNVSVRDQDAPGIVTELKNQQFEWMVYAANTHQIPQAIHDYFETEFKLVEQDQILVYQRVHQ